MRGHEKPLCKQLQEPEASRYINGDPGRNPIRVLSINNQNFTGDPTGRDSSRRAFGYRRRAAQLAALAADRAATMSCQSGAA